MIDQDALRSDRLLLRPHAVLLPEGPQTGLAVVVDAGRFTAVGTAEAVVTAHPDLVPVDLPDILLMPGMIDAHTHLTQSFGKALAFGEPSEIFRRIWVPLEASLDADGIHLAARLACLEALRGGFTTVVDAGTRSIADIASIAAATKSAGLRCVLGAMCNDVGGGVTAILAQAQAHLARWQDDPMVRPSLAISIPEAASDTMLQTVSAMAAEAGAIFQTHANEHLVAVERSLVARGRRPIQLLAELGVLGPHVLLAHATLLTPDEIAALQSTGTAIAYNPLASQWKGNAVAPAGLLAALGVRFGLGTDATRADGFRLVDAAEAAQRLAYGIPSGDFSTGGGWRWLDAALQDGAAAIGLGERIGRIAAGYAADFLLVDLAVPELVPSWDLGWELVRFANRDQIVASFVGGIMRLWHGWPVDWDGRALLREVSAYAQAAVARAPIQRIHPTSRQHRAAHRI